MLRLRLALAVAGFLMALLAVALDNRQLVWAAIALLSCSLILRLLAHRPGDRNPDGEGPV